MMDDYISRQDAIKAIEDLPNCYNGFNDTYDKACIIGVIEELPPAVDCERCIFKPFKNLPSAERVGHWIFNPIDAIELMFAKPKCSECGSESADGGNYCPNCGAKMEGEEE